MTSIFNEASARNRLQAGVSTVVCRCDADGLVNTYDHYRWRIHQGIRVCYTVGRIDYSKSHKMGESNELFTDAPYPEGWR